jgi:hypothetical protein
MCRTSLSRTQWQAVGVSVPVDNHPHFDFIISEFWVNGTSIPFVDWDVGPSWAGLLPISSAANETRKVKHSDMTLLIPNPDTHVQHTAFLLVLPTCRRRQPR